MNLNEYQQRAKVTMLEVCTDDLAYLALGIASEAGEVAGEFNKLYRKRSEPDDYDVHKISEELGDTLWYLSQIALFLGISLEEVAETNLRKLNGIGKD